MGMPPLEALRNLVTEAGLLGLCTPERVVLEPLLTELEPLVGEEARQAAWGRSPQRDDLQRRLAALLNGRAES